MPQTAEGIKKIGILSTLINNGVINSGTILFLDEPETALHPAAQRDLVKILYKISKLLGVQVFIATHSYYIINQLHNVAIANNVDINCLSLIKDEVKSFEVYNLKNQMPNIPIIKEALEMQSEELKIQLNKLKG
jgi:predicted ATPase